MAVSDRAPVEAVDGAPNCTDSAAALGATLFDTLGPGGASLLRQAFAAIILLALWRPRVRSYSAADLRLVAAFGVALGLMNLCFYEALDRIPLGVCVTIEFIGPVAVAVAFSRRRLDLVWVALAVAGIVLLADPFGAGGVDRTGLVHILAAAACWAVYIVLAQRATRVFHGSTGLALAAGVAWLMPLAPGLTETSAGASRSPGLVSLSAGASGMCHATAAASARPVLPSKIRVARWASTM